MVVVGSSSSNSSSSGGGSSSLRELGPVSTHDVLCSWRGVGVETKGREHRFRQRVCENAPRSACSSESVNRCFCNVILGRNFMLAKKCHF